MEPNTDEQGVLIEAADAQRPLCRGCQSPIDPEMCPCGEYVKDHGYHSGHSPGTMGCTCHLQEDDVQLGRVVVGPGESS